MRICFLAYGQSIHTRRYCTYFAGRGHEVHLVTFSPAEIPGVTVHHIDAGHIGSEGGNWRVLLKRGKVKQILKRIQPDLLHALYATSYGAVGRLTGFHPYVLTPLGSDVLVSGKTSWRYRKLLRFVMKGTDLVYALGEHMAEAIREAGAAPGKIIVRYWGVDPEIFHESDKPRTAGHFDLVHTRHFEPVYNIPHLLKAVAKAAETIPNLRLHMAGSGTLLEEMKQLATQLGITGRIIFHGRIAPGTMAGLLQTSHVFLSVSVSDGNNISLNEAMACGAFCIATDIPANRAWIQDGVNGFLVPVNDVELLAKRIVETHHSYEALRVKALPVSRRLIAEHGLWPLNFERIENEYKELVETHRKKTTR